MDTCGRQAIKLSCSDDNKLVYIPLGLKCQNCGILLKKMVNFEPTKLINITSNDISIFKDSHFQRFPVIKIPCFKDSPFQRFPVGKIPRSLFLHSLYPVLKKKTCVVDHHVFQVLVAIHPESLISYFDVQSKTWKELSSMQQLTEVQECFCAELIGNYLYVAAKSNKNFVICCYDVVCDTWSTLPPIPHSSGIQIGSLCHIEDHLYVMFKSSSPYRYSIAKNQWQSIASSKAVCDLDQKAFCNKAAIVYKSCLYVLYGQRQVLWDISGGSPHHKTSSSVLYCFDPKKNVWEQKASTKTPHYGSSLLVVNNNLYVAGGKCSFTISDFEPSGDSAAIEVYNDEGNAWSVVKQTHIPKNNLGAVKIDERVYFIINSFPIDSGITIPPGEVYPIVLDGWVNLGMLNRKAVLCYVPVKTENHTIEDE